MAGSHGLEVESGDEVTKTHGEGAYRRLKEDLVAGRLLPGQRLPLRQLSARYSVGIAPLREALSRLASDRLVVFEGQRGYGVAPVSLRDLQDLCSLRIDLTCKALKLAIERGDEEWEVGILAALHRLERCPMPASIHDEEISDRWEARHDQFHRALISACDSSWLLHFCTMLSDQFQRYRRGIVIQIASSNELLSRLRQQHRTMAEAAIDRQVEEATAILTDHFLASVELVTEVYMKKLEVDKPSARITRPAVL